MAGVRIEAVHFKENYSIDILLNSGHRILYNLEPKLLTARFLALQEVGAFQEGVIVDGNRIRWNVETELTLDEVLMSVQNIKV